MTRILVVEDEPAIAESLVYALSRDGFEVKVAATLGDARLAVADADLVILDLMLPDGSGFELVGAARRAVRPPAIIVLSSRDGEADRVAALETGADDYVTKPFSPREIVARVRAVLRRAGSAADPGSAPAGARPRARVVTPPITVEESTRRAFVSGHSMELTRVEFDLLSCLVAAPGRVYTRAQLIDRVWGDGFAITDRTIDSHVKALRRKVESAGGDPNLIETVRGVGYRVSDRAEPPPSGSAASGGDGGG